MYRRSTNEEINVTLRKPEYKEYAPKRRSMEGADRWRDLIFVSSLGEAPGENRTSRPDSSVSRGRRIYHQRVYDPTMIDFSPGLDSANRHARGLLRPISCKRRLLPEVLVFNLARLVLSSLGGKISQAVTFLAFDWSKIKRCGQAVLRSFMHAFGLLCIVLYVNILHTDVTSHTCLGGCLLQSWDSLEIDIA